MRGRVTSWHQASCVCALAGSNVASFWLASLTSPVASTPLSPLTAQYSNSGLDQAMKQLYQAVEALLIAPDNMVNLDNEQFAYVYMVRC